MTLAHNACSPSKDSDLCDDTHTMMATVIQQGKGQFPVRIISLVTILVPFVNVHLMTTDKILLTSYEMRHMRSSKILLLVQSHKSVDLENGEECLT